MADARAKDIIDLGDRLFAKRDPLLSLWQEIADNFYVERSDFTSGHVAGTEFADHLMDSYPTILRRELGNSISAMLRPRDRQWFKLSTQDEGRDEEPSNAAYLEYVVKKLRRVMYDSRTKFVRATKEGDHDFVTFGNAVISVEESINRDHLYYRTFHLRDCAWLENATGDVDNLHRKDKMTARQMVRKFGEAKVHRTVQQAMKKNPSQEFNVRCVVMPADEYDLSTKEGKTLTKGGKMKKLPYAVVYVDADNGIVMREGGLPDFLYVVPRWHTVSGLQYAYAPTTCIALPDARLIQQMARLILEAGEKSVDPPVVAVEEAVREVNLQSGAITWADAIFDGKLSEVVKPIQIENNMQVAFSMREDMREMLQKAWFIDKLQMPPTEGAEQMTAREVSVRQSEFVRNMLPLFEPMEVEYNTKLLDKSYTLARKMGIFNEDDVPEDLSGADVSWSFESPVQEGAQRLAASQFQEMLGLIGMAAEAGVSDLPVQLDIALKDAIRGVSAPARWFKTLDQIEQDKQRMAEEAEMAGMMQEVQALSETAGMAAGASQQIDQAMLPPQLQGPSAKPALPKPGAKAPAKRAA